MTKSKYILFLIISLLCLELKAQFWETTVGDSMSNVLNTTLVNPDESLLSAGYSINAITTKKDLWLTKTNPSGNIEWEASQGFPDISVTAFSILPRPNGNLLVVGTLADTLLKKGIAWEVNPAGQTQNSWNNFPEDHLVVDAILSPADELIVVGQFGQTAGPNTDAFIGKMNANLDAFEWVHYYGGTSIEASSEVIQLSNGQFACVGYTGSFGNGSLDAFLILFDEQGNINLEKTYGDNFSQVAYGIQEFDQQLWFTGLTDLNQGNDQDVFLIRTNLAGDSLNHWVDERAGLQVGRGIDIDASGTIYITGEAKIGGAPFDLMLQQWDITGNINWNKYFGGPLSDNGKDVAVSPAGNIYAVGAYTQLINSDANGYLIHPNADGTTFTAQINGLVYWDENENCQNNAEATITDWLVELRSANSRWTTTDEIGAYSFAADTGDYQLFIYPPNEYWNSCDPFIPVTLQNTTDTVAIEHGIKANTLCPLLTVDIATPFLRRCFENTYYVEVCNEGTTLAADAHVEINLDDYFDFVSATIPSTTIDNQLYNFELGDLAQLECIRFNLTVLLDCDSTVIGQTHCLEARAFPDSICTLQNADWDESSIEVDAVCEIDSIRFTIRNTGTGTTDIPLEYVITEDHIMLYQGDVDLDPLMDTVIVVPATGGTMRLETEQSAGHPGINMPSIAVEGCGGFPFSLGFIIEYPQNDGNPFIDIDCRENVGSFDPNDKQAFPAGYMEEHFITSDTELEYLIRFQNTGTDTAFNIVIRDTLDTGLDITTLFLGSSSHNYSWNLRGSNILEVHFNNILLPDSTINEAGSHGYVKFTISPKIELEPGAMITNQAAIYFDFNQPIITNETFHTIGIDYIIIDLIESTENPQETANLHFYPNPFLEQINFELINMPAADLRFKIFNSQGKLIHFQEINSNRFSYHHQDRSPGVYFFQIIADHKVLKTGKIIHHNSKSYVQNFLPNRFFPPIIWGGKSDSTEL